MWTEQDAVASLLERKLLAARDLVDGGLSVANLSRRNRNLKVIRDQGTCYLLKQEADLVRQSTLAREAAVYRFFRGRPLPRRLRKCLLRFFEYLPRESVLIVEGAKRGENLREYHNRTGRFSMAFAGALGDALGMLHRITRPEVDRSELAPYLRYSLPWVLSIHRPETGTFTTTSSANIQLIRTIQQVPELGGHLDRLRGGWQRHALIHFDVKWDNMLVVTRDASSKRTLKLVDWEGADVGDPCWDVGSVFAGYLGSWLQSVPISGNDAPDRLAELARCPVSRMHPAIRSFWRSYIKRRQPDTGPSNALLLRATEYAAGRMIQMAFEQLQGSTELTGHVVCILQLSLNILQRPREAIVHLLGLSVQG
jgi:hypothetical protein